MVTSFSSCSSRQLAVPIELIQGDHSAQVAAIRLCICDCIGTSKVQCWHYLPTIPIAAVGACWASINWSHDRYYILLRREGKGKSGAW